MRTVRYYDHVGLLKPSARSDSDQRLYRDADFTRLQQILTLKLIGLSLAEIQQLLATDSADIGELLERQKHALRAQAEQYLRVANKIERAQAALINARQPDLDHTIEIIKAVTTMQNEREWLAQFLTEAQQQALVNQSAAFADQRVLGVAWQTLFADIQQHMGEDVHADAVQALVDRWDALLAATTNGDAGTAAGVQQAYAAFDTLPGLDDAPEHIRAWAQDLRAAAAFIDRARAAR